VKGNKMLQQLLPAKQAYEYYCNGLFTYDELVECIDLETGLKTLKEYEALNKYMKTWYFDGEFLLSFQTFLYWMYDTILDFDVYKFYVQEYRELPQDELLREARFLDDQINANYEMAESSRLSFLQYGAKSSDYEHEAEQINEQLKIAKRFIK
jgi:hypothetical protein